MQTETTLEIGGAKLTVDTEELFLTWLQSRLATPAKLTALSQFESAVSLAMSAAAIPGSVDLEAGEVYIGSISTPGRHGSYHLVLLPGEANDVNWAKAKEWATEQGGELPNRVEGALLYATAKSEFKDGWHWTREQHAVYPDYAWGQHFDYGSQCYDCTSYEGRARAVRRLPI